MVRLAWQVEANRWILRPLAKGLGGLLSSDVYGRATFMDDLVDAMATGQRAIDEIERDAAIMRALDCGTTARPSARDWTVAAPQARITSSKQRNCDPTSLASHSWIPLPLFFDRHRPSAPERAQQLQDLVPVPLRAQARVPVVLLIDVAARF